MKRRTKLAVAFLALAGAATGIAQAQDRRDGPRGDRFERLDDDRSGDVTFEEFAAAMDGRIGAADADNDGKMTVEEIADEIVRMRALRAAKRVVERFDADGDGALTTAEIENRQKKRFALLDRNDDGKIVEDEAPRRWSRHRGRDRD